MNSGVSVILPAAGTGERFGCFTPKQYYHILNRPLICYTIESFIRIPWICKIIIVSSSDYIEKMQRFISTYSREELKRIHITQGGSCRHKSIYLGLLALKNVVTSPEIVVIHDGVRPIVPLSILEKTVDAARIYGAAGAVRPLVSTVVSRNEENFLQNSLDRSKYCASEMPQAFNYDMILESYCKCSEYDLEFGTECLHIVQKYGNAKPKLIMCDEDLWKVTHKKDLYATEGILKENIPVIVTSNLSEKLLLQSMETVLSERFHQVKVDSIPESRKSFDNLNQVMLHHNEHLKAVLDEAFECIPTNSAIVHVIICSEEKIKDHCEVRKKIKQYACRLKTVNSCVYYVCLSRKDITMEIVTEISEVISDLLFNRLSALSGQILYM